MSAPGWWHVLTQLPKDPLIEVTLPAVTTLTATVNARENGLPIAGAIIQLRHYGCNGCDTFTSDPAGRFKAAVPVGLGLTFEIDAENRPHHRAAFQLLDANPVSYVFSLDPGVVMRGQVRDFLSGAELAQVERFGAEMAS